VVKQLVEDVAHREHGWSRIYALAGHFDLPHLAAGSRGPLYDYDPGLTGRKVNGRGQPCHAGAYDRHHLRALRHAATFIVARRSVYLT